MATASLMVPALAKNEAGAGWVISAEREFAAASLATGINASFLKYAALDGVIFRPEPVNAIETIRQDPDDSDIALDWWPALAGGSANGDLGFSVGPYIIRSKSSGKSRNGYYATVWRRDGDGPAKFVVDGAGARIANSPSRLKGSAVTVVKATYGRKGATVQSVMSELARNEAAIARDAAIDVAAAFPRYLADDAWMMGSDVEVIAGKAGWESELTRRPARLSYHMTGGGASRGGDLAYTYGTANDIDHTNRAGSFLRVWQWRHGRWNVIFDGWKHS